MNAVRPSHQLASYAPFSLVKFIFISDASDIISKHDATPVSGRDSKSSRRSDILPLQSMAR